MAPNFYLIDKEPCLFAGTDVPVGQRTKVYGFDFDITGRGVRSAADEFVLHALFLPLADRLELFVVQLSPGGKVLPVGGQADFDTGREENPTLHVVETVNGHAGDGFALQEVDYDFHVALPALPAADAVVGSSVETVNEAFGAVLLVLRSGTSDVAQTFVGNEAGEALLDHGAVSATLRVIGYGAECGIILDQDGALVENSVGVGGAAVGGVVDTGGDGAGCTVRGRNGTTHGKGHKGGIFETLLPVGEPRGGRCAKVFREEVGGLGGEGFTVPEETRFPVGLGDEYVLPSGVDGDAVEEGCDGDVLATAGTEGVESHGAHDVPSAHLSAVLVAAKAVGMGCIELIQYTVDNVVQLVGGVKVGVEIGGVV